MVYVDADAGYFADVGAHSDNTCWSTYVFFYIRLDVL